jgi:hypothetical protein
VFILLVADLLGLERDHDRLALTLMSELPGNAAELFEPEQDDEAK